MRVLYSSWKEYLDRSGGPNSDPAIMPWLFSKSFRKQHPEKIREIKKTLGGQYLSRNSDAFERQIEANNSTDTRGKLGQISVPTLLLVGNQDELTPPRMARELEAEIPNAKLVILEKGGHGLYWEVPEFFNETVMDFLKGQAAVH